MWRYDGTQSGGGHVGEHDSAGWYLLWLKMRVRVVTVYMSVLELTRELTAETMASQSALATFPPPDRLVTVLVEKRG